MEFPITNISTAKWVKDEDPMLFLLDSPFIYSANNKLYYDYYEQQRFVDSRGDVYKLIDRKLPVSFFRWLFQFLPNIYRVELVFSKTNEKYDLEKFRSYMIGKIQLLLSDKDSKTWIDQVKAAKTFKEIMGE